MSRTDKLVGTFGAFNWHAVRLYRLSRRLWLSDHQTAARAVYGFNRLLTGVEIPPTAEFGDGLIIAHPAGIVVHPNTRVGLNCVLLHNVTLGTRVAPGDDAPLIGDDVAIHAGAQVLGGVTIGDGAIIGPNAIVISDVPPGMMALAGLAELRPVRA